MNQKQQRILITGSSGQIGTNLGLRLLQEGYDVLGVDVRPNGWTDAFTTIQCDLTAFPCNGETALAGHIDRRVDMVVHLAANAKVHRSVAEPEYACSNVVMAHCILEFCRIREIPLIFSSSREVYGNDAREAFPESSADFRLAASPYAAGKIAVEAFIYSYTACLGLRYLVVRLSNVYGRYDCDLERMERVVPLFISRIVSDLPVVIYGSGKLLDFTYVDDCVEGLTRGIDLLLNGHGNQTLNISCGRGHSLIELARCIGQTLGREPMLDLRASLSGEVQRYVADTSLAGELLNYVPGTSLEEGIGKTIAWWQGWSARRDSGLAPSPSSLRFPAGPITSDLVSGQ